MQSEVELNSRYDPEAISVWKVIVFEPIDVAEVQRSFVTEGLTLAIHPVVAVSHLGVGKPFFGELSTGRGVGLGGRHRFTS